MKDTKNIENFSKKEYIKFQLKKEKFTPYENLIDVFTTKLALQQTVNEHQVFGRRHDPDFLVDTVCENIRNYHLKTKGKKVGCR